MKVNFYWHGQNFQFANRLTLLSHVVVGHEVCIWLAGKEPNFKYWISDIKEIEIRDAIKYVNTDDLKRKGWKVRMISDLFSHFILKHKGEYISDTDAVALKHWPDEDIVICPEGKSIYASIGVIRLPKNHPVNECWKRTINKNSNNVKSFAKCCVKFKLKKYDSKQFYPVTPHPKQLPYVLRDIKIPDAYSYHLYGNSLSKRNITHEFIKKNPNTLLKRLSDKFFTRYNLFKEN